MEPQPRVARGGRYNVHMTASAPPSAPALVSDLQNIFGDRLRAVVAYGPQLEGQSAARMTSLALVTTLTAADLEACAGVAARWARADVNTPLLLPEDEFRGSLDAFPLEYGEIIRTHVVLFGQNPFAGIAIAPQDLRRACETQVKSHLVHLRQGFVETRGAPAAIGELVRAAAPAFAALLRNVARLGDVNTSDRLEATRAGARVAGIGDDVVAEVLAIEGAPSGPMSDDARFFVRYLAAVEQLARAVDTWQ
jgi:hypothetical protein